MIAILNRHLEKRKIKIIKYLVDFDLNNIKI